MVITGVFDKLGPERIKRLVFWTAFFPNLGECLNDVATENYVGLFNAIAKEDGSVLLPNTIWWDAFKSDADVDLAKTSYEKPNSYPYKTFTDAIVLWKPPA